MTAIIPEEKYIFYRISRHDQSDECRTDEKTVRASLSAWVKDIDRSIAKLCRGERVFTPNAIFYALTVDQLRGSINNRK